MGALAKIAAMLPGRPSGPDGAGGRPQPSASRGGYFQGEMNPFMWSWRPALRDSRDDVRQSYSLAVARAIDAIHNSGWLAGAVDQLTVATVGTGLRLNCKPDTEALGWTPDTGAKWGRFVERRFEAWSNNPLECDMAGRSTRGQIEAKALKSFLATGETVTTLRFKRRSVSRTRTKLQQWQSFRLSQTTAGLNLFQGVWLNDDGMPVGYRFRPAMYPGLSPEVNVQEFDVPARDGAGRPVVVHTFDGEIGQVRGISPLTPVLKIVRQYDQQADATLQTSLLQTIFAATVQSEAPTDQILEALQSQEEQASQENKGAPIDPFFGARNAWYRGTKIDLGTFGRIAHLFPGDKLEFKRNEHPNGNYEAFAKFLLREIAACLGMTFEDFSGDYSGASYAAINNATSIKWPIVVYRRTNIVQPISQAAYEAWLEEEIAAGTVPFPGGLDGFLANRAAAVRSEWRGPPKPQADLLKQAKAVETLLGTGTVSRSAVCSDMGTSYADVAHELAEEMALRKELKLPEPGALPAPDDALSDKLVTEKDD